MLLFGCYCNRTSHKSCLVYSDELLSHEETGCELNQRCNCRGHKLCPWPFHGLPSCAFLALLGNLFCSCTCCKHYLGDSDVQILCAGKDALTLLLCDYKGHISTPLALRALSFCLVRGFLTNWNCSCTSHIRHLGFVDEQPLHVQEGAPKRSLCGNITRHKLCPWSFRERPSCGLRGIPGYWCSGYIHHKSSLGYFDEQISHAESYFLCCFLWNCTVHKVCLWLFRGHFFCAVLCKLERYTRSKITQVTYFVLDLIMNSPFVPGDWATVTGSVTTLVTCFVFYVAMHSFVVCSEISFVTCSEAAIFAKVVFGP